MNTFQKQLKKLCPSNFNVFFFVKNNEKKGSLVACWIFSHPFWKKKISSWKLRINPIFCKLNWHNFSFRSQKLKKLTCTTPPPSIWNCVLSESAFSSKSSEHLHSQTLRARELTFWEKFHLNPPVTCYVSHVMCHMSCVTCHFFIYVFWIEWWS